jgi:hypothetical protein
MKNLTLILTARALLKSLIVQCTKEQQHVFRRMYELKIGSLSIEEVVDRMPVEKLDHAISQCEKTIAERGRRLSKNTGIS